MNTHYILTKHSNFFFKRLLLGLAMVLMGLPAMRAQTIPPTGVSGSVVTLNDLEDHTWTYYSDKPDTDYPNQLRSPEPRNVKITYRGGSVSGASAVAVSASATESQNEFVYYKTIEKKAWGQDEGRWLTGDYAYKVIPNPFSKRPRTNGATGTNGFYGFAGWKIISGGEYINGHNDNDVLDLEEKINFVNLNTNYTPNCISAEIVFEATWTAATVVAVNGNVSGNHGLPNSGTYETNFIVVSGNDRTISGMTRNATVMGCYPDGTGATNARLSTVTGSGNDLKIENINLGTGGSDFTIRAGWLIVGRGCTGIVRRVIGDNSTGTSRRIRIESGTYNFICPMQGGDNNNANNGLIVFGNDYDRATNDGLTSNDQYADNSSHRKLRVINYVSYNGSGAGKTSNDNRDEWMDITVKSGYFGYSADYSLYTTTNANNADGFGLTIGGNTDHASTYTAPDINGVNRTYTNLNAGVNNTTYRWQRLMSFYCGRTRGGNYGGINRVLIEGGELSSINGGGYRNTGNNFDVCYHFRMKGGWVKGAIYGTASSSRTNATTKQVITGGEVNGWVAGACNGTDVDNDAGENQGDTYIYLGGNAELRSHRKDGVYNNAWGLVGGVEGGNLFASGRGTPATTAQPNRNYCGSSYKTYAVVADNSIVEQGVYGGGYIGVAQNSHIYITGGEIGKVYGGASTPTSTNETWMTQTTDIRMYGGTVKEGIYGGHYQGANDAGKIHQDVNMVILNGQIGTDEDHRANVHGGGFGNGTSVGGNVDLQIGDPAITENLIVYGNVYGGSALGNVNTNTSNHTNVTLNKGTINGNLFGGALGDNTYAALVNGNVAVTVNGGKVTGAVFGCNDANGTPKGTVTVTIKGSDASQGTGNSKVYALQGVYGGGNLAHYNPTTATNGYPQVIVNGCSTSIKEVYGGGNAAAVPQTDVTINGGDIGSVFAGGNGISGTPANVGYQNKLEPTTANSYGNGTAIAKIYGGTIGQVFGGSNAHGVIRGNVSVDVDKSKSTANPKCDMIVREVYGGGNMAESKAASVSIGCTGTLTASHSTNPENIGKTLEGIGSVFGGANQADVTSGNIAVTINKGIVCNVFGGNNQTGDISGTIAVTIEKTSDSNDCDWYVGNVFGGGNLAQYTGSPTVDILNGTVSGKVYGGGKGDPDDHTKGQVTGNPVVTIGDATKLNDNTVQAIVNGDVYGGGDAGNVVGTPQVNVINKCNTRIANVYGGGNAADVSATDVNIDGGTITGDVFGGGHGDKDANPALEAKVSGDVSVTVTGGTIHRVFGGSNSKGDIGGDISVEVNKDANSCAMKIDEVYGGGNFAASKAGEVNIVCTGTSSAEYIDFVYGGANQANITGDITLNITGGRINNAFGGNNTSGKINGDIVVNVEWDNACTDRYLGNVYGGGNLAAYAQKTANHPQVNIKNGTVSNNVYGGGKGATAVVTGNPVVTIGDVTNANYSAIVEGNVFGGGDAAAVEGNASVTYNDNNSKSYVGKLFGGGNAANVSGSTTVTLTQGKVNQGVYGGCNDTGSVGEVTLNLNGGTVGKADPDPIPNLVFGGGYGHPTTTTSDINVNLNGTTVYGNLYGGSALGSVNANADNKTTVTLASATLYGSVFGGGMGSGDDDDHKATSHGHAIVNINVANTNLKGIYGGANVNGNVAGDIDVNVKANVGTTGEGNRLDIFGGGYGQHTTTKGDVTVTVYNATTPPVIYGDIYGGSALGNVNNEASDITKIDFLNGTLNGVIYGGGMGNSTTAAMVYGNTEVAVAAGSISGGIYGGCNKNGTVEGNITVGLTGGTVGTSGSRRDVFGGGLGESTQTKGDVTVNFGNQAGTATPAVFGDVYGGSSLGSVNDAASDKTIVNILSGSITGNVYGGGMGQSGAANVDKGKVNGEVVVNIGKKDGDNYYGNASFNTYTVDDKTLGGSVYGCNNTNGSPQYKVTVNVYKTAHTTTPTNNTTSATGNAFTNFAINQVFGGGRQADYTATGQKATVNIFTCDNTVKRVFGGGDAAEVPGTKVVIYGGRFDYVFGGGNGESVAADIGAGGINLTLHGGKINHLFSGSNTSGTIGGPMNVMIDNEGGCDELIGEFFGGSNMVQIGTPEHPVDITTTLDCGVGTFTGVYGGSNMAAIYGNVTLNIKGGTITNAFGGSKGVLNGTAANITGNVTLNLYGGTITNAFGGSDQNGNITGQITLNVLDFENATCPLDVTNIYGGGNLTPYTPSSATLPSPAVNVMHIKQDPGVRGDVYGGGLGATAIVTSKPVVKIGYVNTMSGLIPDDYPDPKPSDFPRAKVTGNVYGGGSLAAVTGSTSVLVQTSNTSILSNVFGGGRGEGDAGAGVSGSTQVQMTAGSVAGALYGGCNYKGTVGNGTTVNMSGGTTGYVYGGGLGENTIVNKSTATYGSSVTLSGNASVTNDVYGGGNAGVVNGGTNVKLTE